LFEVVGRAYAMAGALRARATVPAGTWPLNSTVKTPVNKGSPAGAVEAPSECLAARRVAERDDDERAVGVGGAHAAAVGGDRLAEPAHTRNARVHLVLDRRPLVARGGAEG